MKKFSYLRCDKHIFEFPYPEDLSTDYKKDLLNFNLHQIMEGKIASYDHREDGKDNFYPSRQKYYKTYNPVPLEEARRLEQELFNSSPMKIPD